MAKLTVEIGAKIGGMKRGLANAQASVKTWSRKISGITKLALGTAFVGFGAGIFSIIKKSAQLAAQFEQIKVAFTTMTGSAERAKGLISELNEFSKATPFSPEQVFKAGKTLLAFGFEAKEVSNTLKLLGDVSAGTGKDLGEMAVIFGQIKGAGRLMGQDLLQLINAGFNPLQVMSEKTGKSMAQLKDEMSKGAISFQMVEQAFKDATGAGGIFFNMMEKQSQTLNGQLSTLEGNVNDLARQFGELLLPELKVVVSGVGEAVQVLQELAAARASIESGGVQTGGVGIGKQVMANAAINGIEMASKFFLPFDDKIGEIADKIRAQLLEAGRIETGIITAEDEAAGRKAIDKEAASAIADAAKPISDLSDADFASADPIGDMFAEMRRKWDKAWDDSDARIGKATAEKAEKDAKEQQAKALQDMQDAFQPGGKIQSRLANIGGERSITIDSIQKEMLNVQKQILKANQKVAMALEDYDGPTFPQN